ncbi:hypothetical protein [Sulfolobus spindle-shaped virus]|nr:hypothetical protein [Sulfolobus spindle-shaped virus]
MYSTLAFIIVYPLVASAISTIPAFCFINASNSLPNISLSFLTSNNISNSSFSLMSPSVISFNIASIVRESLYKDLIFMRPPNG